MTEESLSNYTKKAQSLNSKACKITFENLNYSVKVKTNKLEKRAGMGDTKNLDILKNCTGFALPGQTCFIMGA